MRESTGLGYNTRMNTKTEITDRIRERRLALGISQTELGRRAGVTLKQVWKWEKGIDMPSSSRIEAIAAGLNVTPTWLLQGAKPHLGGASDLTKLERTLSELTEELEHLKYKAPPEKTLKSTDVAGQRELPELGHGAAPASTEAKESGEAGEKISKKSHYCLVMRGPSMRPNIYEGDALVVESVNLLLEPFDEKRGPADKDFWKNLKGEVVCASVNDEDPVLKRLHITDRRDTGFQIVLQADNPAAEAIEITREDRLRILGIVRRILRDPKNTA